MDNKVKEFLDRHCLSPDSVSPESCAEQMLTHMKAGLSGNPIDMPMIPTYLKGISEIPLNKPVMVIDAGGTNYRCALAEFDESGCVISNIFKAKMPGTGSPVTWEKFIGFVADSLVPIAPQSETVGFCFSYDADITPEVDGIVHRIDKEVTVTGCEGKHIGRDLSAALEERGFPNRRVIIINDTVAALLGGLCAIDIDGYSDFIGMICGTGINTCAPAARSAVTKLNLDGDGTMLINFESGCYSGMPRGDIDQEVDAISNVPGEKIMEKMCSGAYVGKICKTAFLKAVCEGLLSDDILGNLALFDRYTGSLADSLAGETDEYGIFGNKDELRTAGEIARAVFERSARCMATVILAIMLMNGSGKSPEKPMCVCAEGSLISRSRFFLPELERCLESFSAGRYHRYAKIVLGNETTLPGSAVAALLNT